MTEEIKKLSAAEILELEKLVDRFMNAFGSEELPTDGQWITHDRNKKIVCLQNGAVVATAKSEMDAAYIIATQPDNIRMLLIYIAHLKGKI